MSMCTKSRAYSRPSLNCPNRRIKPLGRRMSQTVTSIGGDTGPPVITTRMGWPSFPILISRLVATRSIASAILSPLHSPSTANSSVTAFSGSRIKSRSLEVRLQ